MKNYENLSLPELKIELKKVEDFLKTVKSKTLYYLTLKLKLKIKEEILKNGKI